MNLCSGAFSWLYLSCCTNGFLTFEMYDVAMKLKPLQQYFTMVLQLGTSLCTAARSPLSAILFEGRGDYTVHRLVPSCSTIEKSC